MAIWLYGHNLRDQTITITMASYALQRHLGWRTQSRLGQNLLVYGHPRVCTKLYHIVKVFVRGHFRKYLAHSGYLVVLEYDINLRIQPFNAGYKILYAYIHT